MMDLPDPNGPPQMVELPSVPDRRGTLTFAEQDWPLPFRVTRAYWIHGIPSGAERGGHAHRETHEAIIAVAGSFRVSLRNPHREEITITLDSPSSALYVPSMWWRHVSDYSEGAVCLVLASLPYNAGDYIREPDDFFHAP